MDRRIILCRVDSARFLAVLRGTYSNALSKGQHDYLLCTAVLKRRRRELVERSRQNTDTSALQRMISRLEASQRAHLEAIKKLEAKQ